MKNTNIQLNSAANHSFHLNKWRRAGLSCLGTSSKTSANSIMPVGSVTIAQSPSDYRLFEQF